ncbi:hypothetical protein [Nocardia sp. NPDC004860]|uniref:hypothetical protein n=1 Tax=Nocardia sp. NPDC004860 TaxID=3154557 RepID=UPI0033A23644
MLDVWRADQVVVRLDDQFVDAIVSSDTNVPMVPDWLGRLPFGSLAASLPTPLPLDDGTDLCRYTGFLATGIVHGTPTGSRIHTSYRPFAKGDGIRFLWVYSVDGDPVPRYQTITVELRGALAKPDLTLAGWISGLQHAAQAQGHPWGPELSVLVPLSVQALLYLTAQEPDLDWIPPERLSRPQQLRTAVVGHVGWRVGSALRTWRSVEPTRPTANPEPGKAAGTCRRTSVARTGTGCGWPPVTVTAASSAMWAGSAASTGTINCAGTLRHRSIRAVLAQRRSCARWADPMSVEPAFGVLGLARCRVNYSACGPRRWPALCRTSTPTPSPGYSTVKVCDRAERDQLSCPKPGRRGAWETVPYKEFRHDP